jgi:hypothetical protein
MGGYSSMFASSNQHWWALTALSMSEIILPPTQPEPEPVENLTPEVSFVRTFLGRIATILRADDDQKAKLIGPARLVAELLDASCKVFLFKAEYEKLKLWQEKTDALQKVHARHTNTEADCAFFSQQKNLHSTATQADFNHSSILSRDQWRLNFQAIRQSALAEQQRLWRENIKLAREIAARVAPVIEQHAEQLETSEKEKFANYGLPYTGSPLVTATRNAAKFVTGRVALSDGSGGPTDCLPWLLL